MKRRLAACVSAALFALALTASASAQAPVKIGVLTPLSPPGDASGGQFIVRGAKMAAEDINARGGVLGGARSSWSSKTTQEHRKKDWPPSASSLPRITSRR